MKTSFSLLSTLSAMALIALPSDIRAERSYLDWFTMDEATLITTPTGGKDVALDSRGNVITAGYYVGNPTAWRIVSHDALSGRRSWFRTLTTTPHHSEPVKVLVDSNNDIVVAGWTGGANGKDYRTVKYEGATGNQLWSRTFNGILSFSVDEVVDMVIDSNNDVIVTGFSQENGSQFDIVTIKYAGTNGADLWTSRYASPGFEDRPSAMALVPGTNDVIVTGKSKTVFEDPSCFITLRYDGQTGVQEWMRTYESAYGSRDEALDVAVTIYGVYVVGRSGLQFGPDLKFQTTVVSYSLTGAQGWISTVPKWVPEARSAARIKATTATHLTIAAQTELATDRYCISLTTLSRQDGSAFGSTDTRPAGYETGDSIRHTLKELILDKDNNAFVIGTSNDDNLGNKALVEKYNSSTWNQLASHRISGGSASTAAVDMTGGIVIVGDVFGLAAAGAPQRMITARYGNLPLSKGDSVLSSALSPTAFVNTIGTPTASSDGKWLSRVVIKDGKSP